MTPPKVGGSSTVARKQSKKPMEILEIEEVVGVLTTTPQENFHRDYLPPQRSDEPQVQHQANVKYLLSVAPVTTGVSSDEDLLGKIVNAEYMNHDITDAHNFPELARDQYLCAMTVQEIGEILLKP